VRTSRKQILLAVAVSLSLGTSSDLATALKGLPPVSSEQELGGAQHPQLRSPLGPVYARFGSDLDIIDNEMCVRSLCFAVTAMSAEWVAGADDVASQCGRESTDSS
jgi:hypothetical protein